MNIEQARLNMVEQQIRASVSLREDVRELMLAVPREDFVPTALRHLAFADVEIPLGDGATMLRPRNDAMAVQILNPKKNDKVLEIGAGSGFMAALLAVHADQVTTIEIVPRLADLARANLRQAGIGNVDVVVGDGLADSTDGNHYDVIMVSGGLLAVPRDLPGRLKVGGRLLAFVGAAPVLTAVLVTRLGDARFRTRDLFETYVAPLSAANVYAKFEL